MPPFCHTCDVLDNTDTLEIGKGISDIFKPGISFSLCTVIVTFTGLFIRTGSSNSGLTHAVPLQFGRPLAAGPEQANRNRMRMNKTSRCFIVKSFDRGEAFELKHLLQSNLISECFALTGLIGEIYDLI